MPDSVKSFFLRLGLRYALPISHSNISKSFKDSSINSILTLSLDTPLEYEIDDISAVMWLSATYLEFLVYLPSILISNSMCTLTCSYPGLILPFLISSVVTSSIFSNSIRTFVISFAIALVQKSVPYCLSISYAYFAVLGNLIPNLCDVRQ